MPFFVWTLGFKHALVFVNSRRAKGGLPLVAGVEAENSQRVDWFLLSCWRCAKLLQRSFEVTDALAHVRSPWDGASSLASINTEKQRNSTHKVHLTRERRPHGGHGPLAGVDARHVHACPSLPGFITSSRAVSCRSVVVVALPFSDVTSWVCSGEGCSARTASVLPACTICTNMSKAPRSMQKTTVVVVASFVLPCSFWRTWSTSRRRQKVSSMSTTRSALTVCLSASTAWRTASVELFHALGGLLVSSPCCWDAHPCHVCGCQQSSLAKRCCSWRDPLPAVRSRRTSRCSASGLLKSTAACPIAVLSSSGPTCRGTSRARWGRRGFCGVLPRCRWARLQRVQHICELDSLARLRRGLGHGRCQRGNLLLSSHTARGSSGLSQWQFLHPLTSSEYQWSRRRLFKFPSLSHFGALWAQLVNWSHRSLAFVWISITLTFRADVETSFAYLYEIHRYFDRLSALVWISHHVHIRSSA